jgi:hypothetical protein
MAIMGLAADLSHSVHPLGDSQFVTKNAINPGVGRDRGNTFEEFDNDKLE